ncbi:GNAT family N-acetyltransferase [Niallia sp. HCP3S3_B10]|uniref:GNAT family N-acetyltransferase n=1 Tax=Niallia sp. HCP3S3_B10 TaxID=3438944 RepID=UPI003F895254
MKLKQIGIIGRRKQFDKIEFIELSTENIDEKGCYCLRSKPKSTGYQGKKGWLIDQFGQGLKYIQLLEHEKLAGFIEYTPIEYSSRVIYGENYYVIHCLWVNITGKGYATQLIKKVIQDAKDHKKNGVIVITNPTTSWTPSKEVFIKNDFVEVEHAPYGFELLVYKMDDVPNPYFPNDWQERLTRYNDQLTILRTAQCPYIDIAIDNVIEAATKLDIKAEIQHLQTREELLKLSPTPYGVYGVIYRNQLISYHRLTVHSAMKRLRELA